MPNNRYSWLADEEFSLHSVLGGARGVAEAVLPGLVFLGAYLISGALVYSALASALCSVIFTVIRIAQRQAVVQAISGLFGVAIAVVWALVDKCCQCACSACEPCRRLAVGRRHIWSAYWTTPELDASERNARTRTQVCLAHTRVDGAFHYSACGSGTTMAE